VDFCLDQLPAFILGTVSAEAGPLGGVTVDLYDSGGDLADSRITDLAAGTYEFEADAGDYTVEIVVPLGYAPAEGCPAVRSVTLLPGASEVVDFCLNQITIVAAARGKGYWKHQYKVHDSGKGHAHEELEDLAAYRAAIFTHFFSRADEHAIELLGVTYSDGPAALTFDDALTTLSARGNAGMEQRAYAQFLALLHNVAALKVSTAHEATEDGASVSQVIHYVGDLLEDGDPSNDELAKDLAEQVNDNEPIAAGLVPLETPDVAYQTGHGDADAVALAVWPNPSRASAKISYAVPGNDQRVVLEIYSVAGRRVRTLVDERQTVGERRLVWRGDDDRGRRVTAGVYFCRLRVGEESRVTRLVLLH
jgi:hypothetical protein